MPTIVCPTCATKLEIDDDMIGEDVQCGSCQQIFKAEDESKRKRSSRSGRDDNDDGEKPRKSKYRKDDDEDDDEDDRPSRRRSSRRDDDDDEDDYDDRQRGRRRSRNPYDTSYGMGITSLVLGIFSLLGTFCLTVNCFWGLIEIVFLGLTFLFGLLSLKTAGKGMGIAGLVLAIIAVLLIFAGVAIAILLGR